MRFTKRSTIYFDPAIHKILKFRVIETSQSISDFVNEAVRHELAEDQEDLAAFKERAYEKTISYEEMLKSLKENGKI